MANENSYVDDNNKQSMLAIDSASSESRKVRSNNGMLDALPAGGSTIDYNGVSCTVKRALANVAHSQTDSNLVTAVAGKKILVIWANVLAGGTATNVTFNTKGAGAGTAISSLKACGANGGVSLPLNPLGWFVTTAAEALTVTTGTGASVGFDIGYIEV